MRSRWPERNPRGNWEITYTVIGGQTSDSPLHTIEDDSRLQAERALSQAFVAATPGLSEANADIAYWATVTRKIIQRGTNPVLHHATIASLASPRLTSHELVSAIAGPAGTTAVDPAFELHPTHEVPFWTRITASDPRLGRWIVPQAPLEALARRQDSPTSRWVDFVASFPWDPRSVVIEIDGAGHERQPGVDQARDELLAEAGLPVVRIPGADVHSDQSEIMRRIKSSAPEWLTTTTYDQLRSIHAPVAAQRFAYAIVEAVERGFLEAATTWSIAVVDTNGLIKGVEPVALDLLAAIADIWELPIVPDTVTINDSLWAREPDGRFVPTDRRGTANPSVEIYLEPFVAPHAPLEVGATPSIVIRSALFPVDLPWASAASAERRDREATDRSDAALDRLLQDIYGYDSFREGQKAAISRVLSGGDACVLLPTGAGKSLIYQLAGLLRPGVTLIVAPLKSLIDDQVRRFEDSGIDRVAGLHSGTTSDAGVKLAIQEAIATGESLFVLVAPERLQIQEFRTHLREAAAHQQINLAVVDEAHCVSEWGHQFRTSYLKLGRNLRRFCAGDDDVPPPILALTATASPRVLNDLLDELGLDRSEEGVLHRPASFDRPNLHYRILRGDVASREGNVEQSLTDIANDLGVPPGELAEPLDGATRSGIVFVPHASSGLGLGVVHYRDLIADTLGLDPSEIALFAGTKPKEFENLTKAQWEEEKVRYADAFRRNELPIMVSTNAFGMGIDKPNIRFTIHVTQPSSIEAFAQEAGRSGRDKQNAYCYLVSSNAPTINQDTIDNKSEVNVAYAKDDILIQIGNLMSAFPAADSEKDSSNKVLFELLTDGKQGRSVSIPRNLSSYPPTPQGHHEQETEKRDRERAIYRLLLLGVVDDYTIDYGAGTYTVYLNVLDPDQILETTRALISRMAGGSQKYTSRLDDLDGSSLDALLPTAIDALIDTLYGTVEPGRANALREMYLMTRLDDPEAIREKINAYLSDGPVALILDKIVRSETTLADALEQLEETPQSSEEWAGAATRYLDAYADHPTLLVVRALGEAWRSDGSREEFANVIERLATSIGSFGMDWPDQYELLQWMLNQLRTYFEGKRWGWAPDVWHALEDSGVDARVTRHLETAALGRAANGVVHPAEIETIVAVRLRRVKAAAELIVARLAETG